jgi:hypothetical protein
MRVFSILDAVKPKEKPPIAVVVLVAVVAQMPIPCRVRFQLRDAGAQPLNFATRNAQHGFAVSHVPPIRYYRIKHPVDSLDCVSRNVTHGFSLTTQSLLAKIAAQTGRTQQPRQAIPIVFSKILSPQISSTAE